MDLLKRPARGTAFALVLLLGILFPACEREFENPYLPDSDAYAGSEWSRDGDGDGIADSVEKYAPGCGDGPAECLRRAQAKASEGGSPVHDLLDVVVEDLALLEGGPGIAPAPRWQPPHIDIVYTFVIDDPSVAEARDSLILPRGEGATTGTLTARGARGGATRTARFRVSVTRVRVPVTSVTAEDLRLAPGATAFPRVAVHPPEATERGYELMTHDPRIVTVRQGMLVAGEAGSTLVTARSLDGGKQALFRVTVKADVRSVTAQPMLLQVGVEPLAPALAFNPSDATDKSYLLSGGDPAVAVPTDDRQRVRAVGPGVTSITATVEGGITVAFQVTVERPVVAVRSVKVKDVTIVLLSGLDSRLRTPEVAWTPEDATDKGYTLVS